MGCDGADHLFFPLLSSPISLKAGRGTITSATFSHDTVFDTPLFLFFREELFPLLWERRQFGGVFFLLMKKSRFFF